MKTLILLLVFTGTSFPVTPDPGFCKGWEDGYCEGWKSVRGQQIMCPIAPYCPATPVGCTGDYTCGFTYGVRRGVLDSQE